MSPNFDSGPMTPVTRPATVPDVLDAAADHIQQHGWCQGDYAFYPEDDSVEIPTCCAAGAIQYVIAGDAYDYCVGQGAKEALLLDIGTPPDEIFSAEVEIGVWNDRDERTADEVIATLRRVATEHRNAQNGGA